MPLLPISEPMLAQGSAPVGSVLLWVAVLIAVIMAGGLGIMLLRRRVLSRDDTTGAAEGLLEHLRRMRDRGEMSPQEYDAARKAMAARMADAARAHGEARAIRERAVRGPPETEGKGDASTDNQRE